MRTLAVFHLAETSGPSRSLEAELEWAASLGSLEVVVPGPGRVAETFGRFGQVTVLPYGALTLPRGPRAAAREVAAAVRRVRMFRARIRAARPDIVVVVTSMLPVALLAARLEGVPAVVYVGELLSGGSGRRRWRRAGDRVLTRATARWSSAIAACSRLAADPFERAGARDVAVVYPPIAERDLEGDGERFRRELGIEVAAPCVVAVGNVTRGRGQDVLLRALPGIRRDHPGTRCAIVGAPFPRPQDVAYREELERLAAQLGVADAVAFAGFRERVEDAYAAADVFVNPVRVPESFGRASCEALVAGCPVVASRVGAIPEVLRDSETALLVEPEDPAALAAAVGRLLGAPDEASQLAAAGRSDVLERFAPERSLEAFERVIERVSARSPAPGARSPARG